MIKAAEMFGPDPGKPFDFTGVSPAQIFNNALVPAMQQFDPPTTAPVQSSSQISAGDIFSPPLANPMNLPLSSKTAPVPQGTDYNAPVDPAAPAPVASRAGDLTSFVKGFEGFSATPFKDYHQTSIGYGTVAGPGDQHLTEDEASARLANELDGHRQRVTDFAAKHGYDFAAHQIDALTSFDYNTGRLEQLTDNGKRSMEEIAAKIPEYRKAGSDVLPGLVRRRAAEQSLFTQGY